MHGAHARYAIDGAAAFSRIFEEEMEKLKEMSHERLVIVDFFAPWCGPCKSVKRAYEILAEQEATVKFAKLDIDIYEVSET
nr:thioredoxin [Hymenolepis microstoma]